jgi:hypothetical protein
MEFSFSHTLSSDRVPSEIIVDLISLNFPLAFFGLYPLHDELSSTYLQSIGFRLRHPLDFTNRNVFFGCKYTAEYLTTNRDYCLPVDQIIWGYFVIFLAFICVNVNSGALIPRRSAAHREGRRISFITGFMIGYLFVVHVFEV